MTTRYLHPEVHAALASAYRKEAIEAVGAAKGSATRRANAHLARGIEAAIIVALGLTTVYHVNTAH